MHIPEGWHKMGCLPAMALSFLLILLTVQVASAQIAIPPPSNNDMTAYAQIVQPIWKVYNFIKYIATVIAALVLLVAGIVFMASGNDVGKRDTAKHMMSFVVLGLVVVWVTPWIVAVLTTT